MSAEQINEAQKSLPAQTFGTDITTMLGMGSSMPTSVMSGAINDHMSGQMDNAMSDMMDFPEQAGAFKSNGIASMVQGVDALHQGDSLDAVVPETWGKMSGFGADMTQSLGFDPSIAAGGDLSGAREALDASRPSGINPNAPANQAQAVAQTSIDGAHGVAKTVGKLAEKGVEAEGGILSAEANAAGKVASVGADVAKGTLEMDAKIAGGALDVGENIVKADAKVAGKAADAGEEALSIGGKALGGVADLAKSPVGKVLGKAALPLGIVGGAVALGSDAGTFGDALSDPFDTRKLGKARDALREDLPIPGAPLVIDAVTDPSKLLDAGKDIGKAVTDPSMDNLKKAGSKVMDELGF